MYGSGKNVAIRTLSIVYYSDTKQYNNRLSVIE